MHYKNGREAKNGDKIIVISPYGGPPMAGILYDAVAGNDYCNGRIAVTSTNDPCPNLKECLHVDDVKAADIPNSDSVDARFKAANADLSEVISNLSKV